MLNIDKEKIEIPFSKIYRDLYETGGIKESLISIDKKLDYIQETIVEIKEQQKSNEKEIHQIEIAISNQKAVEDAIAKKSEKFRRWIIWIFSLLGIIGTLQTFGVFELFRLHK